MNLDTFWSAPVSDDDEPRYYDPLATMADALASIAAHLTAQPGTTPEAAPAIEVPATRPTSSADVEQLERDLEALEERYCEADARAAAAEAQIEAVLGICKPSVGKLAVKIRAALTPEQVPEPQDEAVPVVEVIAPAVDAPLEDWQNYAADHYGVQPADLEGKNRSQIRTMLGYSHTSEVEAP